MREFREWLEQNKDKRLIGGQSREELRQWRLQNLCKVAKDFTDESSLESLRLAFKVYDSTDSDYDEAEYQSWIASIRQANRKESRLDKTLLEEFDYIQSVLGSRAGYDRSRWIGAYQQLMDAIRADNTLLLQRETTTWLARCSAIIDCDTKVELFEELWHYCRDGADNGAVSSILAIIASSCRRELRDREKNNDYILSPNKTYHTGVCDSVRYIKNLYG